MKFAIFALSATLAVAPLAAAPLLMPAVPDYVLAHSQKNATGAIAEYVPRGQTVQNYSRMITTNLLGGFGKVPSPALIKEFVTRYVATCPGAKVLAVPMGGSAGARIDCTRHPKTGKTETVFARAIPAGADQYLAHITYRYIPMPKETQWARSFLGAMKIG
ncbi:MAG: hypothetical protein Q7J32_06765 [Sphingomonadaceae bacterium]|nr:hypothetical protein [Sphingomonadaceae bacterium]